MPGASLGRFLACNLRKGASARAGGRGQTKRRACSEPPASLPPRLPRGWGTEGRKGTRSWERGADPPPLPSSLTPDPCLLPDGPDRLADPGPENARALLKEGRGRRPAPATAAAAAPSPEGGRGSGRAGQGPRRALLRFHSASPSRSLPRPPPPARRREGQEPGSGEAGRARAGGARLGRLGGRGGGGARRQGAQGRRAGSGAPARARGRGGARIDGRSPGGISIPERS